MMIAPAPSTTTAPASPMATRATVTERLALPVLPLAGAISWWSIAAHQAEPGVAAEARYLGLVGSLVLLAAVAAAERIGPLLATAAVLFGAAPWALPGTADRGAAVGVLLVATLAVAAASGTFPAQLEPRRATAIALGAQLLARSGDLLAPALATVAGVVAWAVLAVAATLVLATRRGPYAAALAAAVSFALGPGWTAESALALAVMALASLAADPDLRPALRAVAAIATLAPMAWDPARGALLATAAVALAGPAWARSTAALAGLAAFFAPGADRGAALEGAAWLLVLVPLVLADLGREPAARIAALALGLAAGAHLSGASALAAPGALLAATMTLDPRSRPLVASLQGGWSASLAALAATLAAYPWLRESALRESASVLGLGAGAPAAAASALAVVAVTAGASLLLMRAGPGRQGESSHGQRAAPAAPSLAPGALVVVLAALALLRQPTATALPIARLPVELGRDRPSWSLALDPPAAAASLRVGSSLSHATGVPTGTVIAEIRLVSAGGERVLPLRAGVDTGEWAARRADVASAPGFAAPPPFLHWVSGDGSFFGQRYRARPALEPAALVTAIEVRLAPDAPAELVLTLFHLELVR